jgi:transcriptional regulator with XRE-family HTH domain
MIGSELRQWRTDHNLTQSAAAKALGVSYPCYKRWESEKRASLNIPQPVALLIGVMGKQ